MNELKFTVYKAWLDAVTERGLTPSRVQGHNNFECVVDGVLVAFWNGHTSTGTLVDRRGEDQPAEQIEQPNEGHADV